MKPKNTIWVFMGEGSRFPSGAFESRDDAESWIAKHHLSGLLSAMPVNQGVFDWAVVNNALSMKPETLEKKQRDSYFIGTCTTAALEHYHYEHGIRQ